MCHKNLNLEKIRHWPNRKTFKYFLINLVMEVKKALEVVVGACLMVAGMTSQQHFLTAAGVAELAKVVATENKK